MALTWVEEIDLTGPEGPQGPQGAAGEQGPTGSQGPQGETGPAGTTGPEGPAGTAFNPELSVATYDDLPGTDPVGTARLVRGPGSPSAEGPAGHIYVYDPADPEATANGWLDMGQSAYVGPAGPAGEAGIQGPTGEQGPQGVSGPKGDTGDVGPIGPAGPIGDTGPQGPQGPVGPTGPQGETGAAGPAGADGAAGAEGVRGSQIYSHLATGGTPPTSGDLRVNDRFIGSDGKLLVLRDI